MSIPRPLIAARLFGTPLAADEAKATAIVEALGPRLLGHDIFMESEAVDHRAFQAGRLGDRTGRAYDRAGEATFDRVGRVGIIAVEGTLVHKGNYVGAFSGRTSYQGLQAQIARAGRDPTIAGVAFEVDSFGGEVSGLFETAGMIAKLSEAKPTIAILTDHALSAGYALACGARQIVAAEHGLVGSIGAIMLHADMSAALEKGGIKVTVLRAGARKADMNPYEKLGPAAATDAQNQLEGVRGSFADLVGRNRGARFSRAQALATEAAAFDGSTAVDMGLADAVSHAGAAFDQFVSAVG